MINVIASRHPRGTAISPRGEHTSHLYVRYTGGHAVATAGARMALTSTEYTTLMARYLYQTYHRRGIVIYREVFAGKSIIGKNRRVDLLLVCEATNQAYALECKYQGSQGTADEKIPYALEDLQALRMSGCLVYAGAGWSEGVLHLLRASPYAAHCLPTALLGPSETTRELDHLLAMHFGWWDVLTHGKQPFVDARATRMTFDA